MKFIVDAQLPPALASWLKDKGHDAQHVSDIGLLTADDGAILDRTITENAVLISKDRDFVRQATCGETHLGKDWQRLDPPAFTAPGYGLAPNSRTLGGERAAYRVALVGISFPRELGAGHANGPGRAGRCTPNVQDKVLGDALGEAKTLYQDIGTCLQWEVATLP